MTSASLLEVLSSIISLITGGITGIATGIGEGLSTLVSALFFAAEGGLSVFAGVVFIFVGISLSMSLCRFVVNFVTSLGCKK